MISPRQLIVTFFKIAIPVGIIAYLVSNIEPEQWHELSSHSKNYPLLAVALLVAITAIGLSFARWCLLVRCQGIQLSLLEAFRLGAICFLLNFVSVGSVGGDLFKALFLARRRPGKSVEAVASVLVDRGVGLYGLLLLASAALLFHRSDDPFSLAGQDMNQIKLGTAVLVISGTAVLLLLVLGGRFVDALVQRASRLPLVGGLVAKVGPPLRMFHDHPIAFAVAIAMSLGVHSLLTLSMYLIARSLYASVPTLAEHFVIVPIGMLASALPISPAGIGVLELAMKWLYEVIPAKTTNASGTLVALVFEVVRIIVAALGTVFYWTAGEEVRESLDEAEDQPTRLEASV
ncbi:flippase-like domain-containing protein [Roseiconus nitratireducens]|uniref:Flippase-like domain-containing protein n=1 Tax=Roseiconus nitratireducens TaxID=2605748 RepID=A0A5M6DLE3_9BACT|nr:lysylphosphatidylglycerol synthase transmembrane domain-containing protein [Roseiconus nitratireducens]KAA5546960.1 flippase-like domain-containing protein [Roseiconus nitratireducens]